MTTASPTNPALASPLFGKVLIEASAGTGKTWTLSTLIVRLLLERGAAAQSIIATTFTRKAATELQRRISDRITDFERAYRQQSALPPHARAQHHDALYAHLFTLASQNETTWQQLGANLQTALAQRDQLYIGTLDGLCQKWLLENRLETGVDEQLSINEDPELSQNLVHQHLRQHHHQLAAHAPTAYADYLKHQANSGNSQHFHKLAQSALTFSRAQLLSPSIRTDRPAAPPLPSLEEAQAWFEWLSQSPTNKNAFNDKRLNQLQALSQGSIPAQHDDRQALLKLLSEPKFKKGGEAQANAFQQHPVTQNLIAQLHAMDAQQEQAQSFAQSALFHIAQKLRQQLPLALAQHHQTTFSDSLQRLNRALEQHPHLARHLNHRYPIILVDESQDLNDEQSALLERLYLHHQNPATYWLLVGDPKQAIYQFRGGDVENYQRLKSHFAPEECYQLTENHRSHQGLLDALNHHYHASPELGDGILYHKVRAAKPQPSIRPKHGTASMFWLETNANLEAEHLAAMVAHLISPQSAFVDEHGQSIQASDILVLMPKGKQLEALERALKRYGLSADLQSERSVFTSPVAQALALLLQAMVQPRHQAWQSALLRSVFYGLTWQQLKQQTSLSLTLALSQAQERWQRHGLLSALHAFLREQKIWHSLARSEQPRQWLSDLRRVLEIVAARANHQSPEAFIAWWLQQCQRQPTAEWAQPYPTRQSHAVRLMTIHKAKGLQAKVVLVGGFGQVKKISSKELQLFQYYDQHTTPKTRVLSADPPDDAILQTLHQAAKDEQKRLVYVALTRAEQLLFVYRRTNLQGASPTLDALFEAGDHPAVVRHYPPPPAPASALAHALPATENADVVLPKQRDFYGSYRSSFSALTRDADDVERPDYDQHSDALAHDASMPFQAVPFQDLLPRGTAAGSWLHEVFEQLHFHAPSSWAHRLQQLAERHRFTAPNEPLPRLPEYLDWLQQVVNQPLHASGLRLNELAPKALCKELGFTLSVQNPKFSPQALNQLFAKHGKALWLKPDDPRHYTFLRGEIDLLYQHDGKYYLLDYKTNLLESYHQSALQRSMDEHQYWLQAALYQLAAFRFVRANQPAQSALDQLGAVSYFYVRGLAQLVWDVPAELILELDALLG